MGTACSQPLAHRFLPLFAVIKSPLQQRAGRANNGSARGTGSACVHILHSAISQVMARRGSGRSSSLPCGQGAATSLPGSPKPPTHRLGAAGGIREKPCPEGLLLGTPLVPHCIPRGSLALPHTGPRCPSTASHRASPLEAFPVTQPWHTGLFMGLPWSPLHSGASPGFGTPSRDTRSSLSQGKSQGQIHRESNMDLGNSHCSLARSHVGCSHREDKKPAVGCGAAGGHSPRAAHMPVAGRNPKIPLGFCSSCRQRSPGSCSGCSYSTGHLCGRNLLPKPTSRTPHP